MINFSRGTNNVLQVYQIAAFKEDFLSRDGFQAVLAIFFSYDYDVNAFEAVEKIATDEKGYLGQMLLVLHIDTEKKVDYKDTSGVTVKKTAKDISKFAQKRSNDP